MENRLFIRLAISIPIVNILMDMIMIFFSDLKSQIGILRTSYLLFIILYFIPTIWIRKDSIQYIITVLSIIYIGHDSSDYRS